MKDVATFQKLGILSVLSIIGSVYILLLKYSRVISKLHYISSTVVALQEVAKLVFTLCVLLLSSGGIGAFVDELRQKIFNEKRSTLLMAIPSCLYALQNSMMFLALANINVPTQQVLYQLKIPFTALLCAFWLKKALSPQQWLAVFMIFFGTSVIEYKAAHDHLADHKPTQIVEEENLPVGLAAIVIASLCSAVAGVYFEKLLKNNDSSIWIKNLQMYLWSVPVTLLSVIIQDLSKVKEKGFFFDYNLVVLLIILISSIGGILVSLVLLYTDNVTKTFSTSVSVLLSTFLSCLLFGNQLSPVFIVGLTLVIFAILIYAVPCDPASLKRHQIAMTSNNAQKPDSHESALKL